MAVHMVGATLGHIS